MAPRIASNSSPSSSVIPFIPEQQYAELLAVLQAPSSFIVTPLGIKRERDHLVARLYPGTRVYSLGYSVYEVCLAQPYSPLSYYNAVLKHGVSLIPAKAIHAPCPKAEGPRIEAVISARYTAANNTIVLVLEPILVEEGSGWYTYTRSFGCSIELLIAFTRLRHWAHYRIEKITCNTIRWLVYTVLLSYNCILRSTWDPEVHRAAATTAKAALDYAYLTGCVAPSDVEEAYHS